MKSVMFRFSTLTCHFAVVCVLWYTRVDMVQAQISYGTKAQMDDDYRSLNAAFVGMWSFALLCTLGETAGLMSGLSTHLVAVNTVDGVLHFLGTFFLLWAILDGWTINSFFVVTSVSSVVPAAIDAAVLLQRAAQQRLAELFL